MEFAPNPDGDKAAFNAGFEYLRTLTTIEREFIRARIAQDFYMQDNLLDSYWMLMREWIKKKEDNDAQELARKEQKDAFNRIRIAIQHKQPMVSNQDLEAFNKRFMLLLKAFHDTGLRMPTRDDPNFAIGGKHY